MKNNERIHSDVCIACGKQVGPKGNFAVYPEGVAHQDCEKNRPLTFDITNPELALCDAEFIKWMAIGKYLLVDGEFVEQPPLRILSDEEVKTLYSRFVDSTTGVPSSDMAELVEPSTQEKLEATLSALKNLQTDYLAVNEQVLQLQAELFKAKEMSEEHEKQRDFWHFEAQREHREVEELKAKLQAITADQPQKSCEECEHYAQFEQELCMDCKGFSNYQARK